MHRDPLGGSPIQPPKGKFQKVTGSSVELDVDAEGEVDLNVGSDGLGGTGPGSGPGLSGSVSGPVPVPGASGSVPGPSSGLGASGSVAGLASGPASGFGVSGPVGGGVPGMVDPSSGVAGMGFPPGFAPECMPINQFGAVPPFPQQQPLDISTLFREIRGTNANITSMRSHFILRYLPYCQMSSR